VHSSRFKGAYERWQRFNWSRQAHQGLRARENLKELWAKGEEASGGLAGQTQPEGQGCCPDPSQASEPLRNAATGPKEELSVFPSEQEMWRRWEEEQQQKREAELQGDVVEGTWTGC